MKNTKTNLCLFILMTALTSGIYAQELSEQQKNLISTELHIVFRKNIRAGENLDIKEMINAVDDNYKAGFITNGIYYPTFDSLMTVFSTNIRGISGQKINIRKENITVLSADLALITALGKSEVYLESGTVFSIAIAWSFVYKKINGNWKVIYSHQSGRKID